MYLLWMKKIYFKILKYSYYQIVLIIEKTYVTMKKLLKTKKYNTSCIVTTMQIQWDFQFNGFLFKKL